ncbi:hypothetical protein GSI_02826 [Ganoderma sinense ZZ0214-1]|uniref:F-box domain-containing protein n=1 Tax=Ganoderma sinense ZZ0214-1 TaxID=1077348 RepID=A0A2G8SMR6_9APHY|nr:hypothetical protein GSI_02826 [Ganoderma sinense ZZ0214-1]
MPGSMYPSPSRHIGVVEDLYRFIDDVEADVAVALAITHFTVELELEGPVPIVALRQCLSLIINATDLVLLLPLDTPPHLLDNEFLPKLELFKTNLPHGDLLPFLRLHPHLSALCLHSCRRRTDERVCPLRAINLSGVLTMECPAGCAPGATRRQLIRLAVDDRPSVDSIPQALRSFGAPSLLYLSMDFFPDDYDILREIASVAPCLRKLTLLEKHRNTRRQSHSRHAWNDVVRWSGWLLKLEYLEELALRTAAEVVRRPAIISSEKAALLQWISGTQRQAKHRPQHPTLTSIRVWYRCRDANHGVITNWSRYTGTWENTLLLRNPLPTTLF